MFNHIRAVRRNEEGAAMITALLFVIVMLFLLASISVTAISGLDKAKTAQAGTNLTSVVDTAINNAVSTANYPAPGKDISDFEGLSKAVYGVADFSTDNSSSTKYKWLWYVEGVSDAVLGESYDIVAKAYRNDYTDADAKTVRVRLQALPVDRAQYLSTGVVSYSPIAMGSFAYGFMGLNGFTMNDGATVKSYNSALNLNPVPANDTRIGTVSSNKLVAVNTTATDSVSRIVLLSGSSSPIPVDRCTTTANCAGKLESFAYAISVDSISRMVLAKCPLGASSYPDWKASLNGGVFNPDVQGNCFNNVIFDTNTEVSGAYSSGKAAEMYIAGNVTVNAGVEVNESDLRGGPLALRIYSAAGTFAKFNSGTAADPTKFSGMVAGQNYACSDSNALPADNKSLILRGSLACDTITLGAGTQAWWDQQTVQVLGAGNDRNIQTVWTPTSYDAEYK
jgi:hypothetical protein